MIYFVGSLLVVNLASMSAALLLSIKLILSKRAVRELSLQLQHLSRDSLTGLLGRGMFLEYFKFQKEPCTHKA